MKLRSGFAAALTALGTICSIGIYCSSDAGRIRVLGAREASAAYGGEIIPCKDCEDVFGCEPAYLTCSMAGSSTECEEEMLEEEDGEGGRVGCALDAEPGQRIMCSQGDEDTDYCVRVKLCEYTEFFGCLPTIGGWEYIYGPKSCGVFLRPEPC